MNDVRQIFRLAVEDAIDKAGLAVVLNWTADIVGKRATHIETAWQDSTSILRGPTTTGRARFISIVLAPFLAHTWLQAADYIDQCADRVALL